MRKNVKKGIALLLIGMTLCGTAITVHAAGCNYEHHGVRISAGAHTNSFEHIHGSKTCKVTQQYEDYKVVCTGCGAVLSRYSELKTENHVIK